MVIWFQCIDFISETNNCIPRCISCTSSHRWIRIIWKFQPNIIFKSRTSCIFRCLFIQCCLIGKHYFLSIFIFSCFIFTIKLSVYDFFHIRNNNLKRISSSRSFLYFKFVFFQFIIISCIWIFINPDGNRILFESKCFTHHIMPCVIIIVISVNIRHIWLIPIWHSLSNLKISQIIPSLISNFILLIIFPDLFCHNRIVWFYVEVHFRISCTYHTQRGSWIRSFYCCHFIDNIISVW